jgi:hypothetical protein
MRVAPIRRITCTRSNPERRMRPSVATRADGVYWRPHMRRSPRFVAAHVTLVLCVATACTRSSRHAGDGEATSRADTPYRRACAPCHGVDGRGTGPVATTLRTPPADLTLLAATNGGAFPREAVVATIVGERAMPAHGNREMPVWSIRFEPSSSATAAASIAAEQRIDAIVRELEALQRSPGR